MKTIIYYYGIDEMSVEYLKSDKFKDRMNLNNLEPEVITEKTALMTSVKFRKDNFSTLFLITPEQKDKWLSENKEKFISKKNTMTVSSFEDLEGIIQEVFSVDYDPVRSAINFLENDDGKEILQENLKSSEKSLKNDLDVPAGGTASSESPSVMKNGLSQLLEESDTGSDNLSQLFNTPSVELDMVKDSEKTKASDFLFEEGYHEKKVNRTKENQFVLVEFEDSEKKSKAIEQTIDVTGFEVTSTKESEELMKYKKRIKELQQEIQAQYKKYLEYKSPDAIKELTDSYIELQDKYDDLDERYTNLMTNGDPNTNKALIVIKEELDRVKSDLDKAREDNENLFSENKSLLEDKKDLQSEYRNLTSEFNRYKEMQDSKLEDMQNKDSFEYLQENIKLSEANRALRQDVQEKDNIIDNLKRDKLELSKGIVRKTNSDTGNFILNSLKRYENITVVVSLGDNANGQFYNSVLPTPEFSSGKDTLVDLARGTRLTEAFKLTKAHNPLKFLLGEKSLNESLSRAVSLNGTGVEFNVLSTSAHGIKRDALKMTDWNVILTELNKTRCILYLGNLEDSSVYDFVRELQQKDTAINIMTILSETLTKVSMFNLEGLKASKLSFVGQNARKYSKLKVDMYYQPLIR